MNLFQLMIVTGGNIGKEVTTEIYSNNVWKTVAAKLPYEWIHSLEVISIANRVILFGNWQKYILTIIWNAKNLGGFGDSSAQNKIFEYNHTNQEWIKIGKMKEARYGHAVSVVTYSDYHYAKWCNWNKKTWNTLVCN